MAIEIIKVDKCPTVSKNTLKYNLKAAIHRFFFHQFFFLLVNLTISSVVFWIDIDGENVSSMNSQLQEIYFLLYYQQRTIDFEFWELIKSILLFRHLWKSFEQNNKVKKLSVDRYWITSLFPHNFLKILPQRHSYERKNFFL